MNPLSSGIARRIHGLRYGRFVALLLLCLSAATGVLQAQVTADFIPNRTEACPGSSIAFNNTSSFPASANMVWSWTFPTGLPNADTARNPSVFFGTPGLKTITLTATDLNGGGSDVMVQNITIWVPPTASFTPTVPDVCRPLRHVFNNTSSAGDAPITGYTWTFGDGTGDAGISPNHVFPPSGGPFTVVLEATDANSCLSSLLIDVDPADPLTLSVAQDSSLACGPGPLNVNFTAAASGGTGPYTYAWDFGDGSSGAGPLVGHVYAGCGTYDVVVTVTDNSGCSVVDSVSAGVELFCPSVDFTMSADTVCAGEVLLVSDASTPGGGTSVWQFDQGNPASNSGGFNAGYVYSAPGTYTIEHCMQYANGCVECITRDVVVRNKPLAGSIVASDSFSCTLPFQPTLTAVGATGVAPINYEWQIDGATYLGPAIMPIFNSPGSYDVRLIVTDATGCTDTILAAGLIRVRAASAAFTLDPPIGCDPFQTTVTNTSTSPVIPIDSFVWDMGDGTVFSSTTVDTFIHAYGGVGTYDVTLIAYTPGACNDTATQTVLVGRVDADFEMLNDTVCSVAEVLNYTGFSDYTVMYWGNGDSTVLPDPLGDYSYFYGGIDTPTLFTITMLASFNGCVETVQRDILVLPPVAYERSVSRDCSDPYTVTLQVDSSILVGSFCWDVGNGDTLCDQNPVTITFPSEGIYRVYLRDPDNPFLDTFCVQDFFDIPIVDADADWYANDSIGCETLTVGFGNAEPNPLFDSLTYVWQIGPGLYTGTEDEVYAPGDTFNYTFNVPDIYPVRMLPRDSSLCNAGYMDTIVVSDLRAYFTIDSITGCVPALVHFSDSSYNYANDPRLAITRWQWTFDNPLCPDYDGQNPPPCAYDPGNYTAYLRVTDAAGCVKTYGRAFRIGPDSVFAAFGHTAPVCGNDTTYFNNGSTSPNGIAAAFWDFGDGTTSTELNPQHIFPGSGTYTVRVTVTDSNGCVASRRRDVEVVMGDVDPDFTLTYLSASACPPIPVRLINTSVGSIAGTEWILETNVGTFNTTGDTAQLAYTQSGAWDITMIVTDTRGCSDTLTRVDTVFIPGPTGELYLDPVEGCAPHTVSFDLENIVADQIFVDFGNGDTLEVFGDFDFTYDDPGVYCPQLILLDSLGCETTYNCPSSITVYDAPRAGLVVGDPSICDGGQFWVYDTSFAMGSSALDSVLLDLGDGTTYAFAGGFDSLAHTYGANGIYTVTMVAINDAGCTDTATAEVGVGPLPSGGFRLLDSAGCAPVTIAALLTGVVADSAFIDWGDGTTVYTDSLATHTYTTPGTYIPRMILRDATGCEIIVLNGFAIPVGYAPTAAMAIPDTSVCEGEPVLILNQTQDTVSNPAINPVDELVLFWDGTPIASGVGMDSVWHPTSGLRDTFQVMLVAASQYGCADTALATVEVNARPTGTFAFTNGIGCAPFDAGINLLGLSADSAWLDWGDGTRELVTGAGANHLYADPGIYEPTMELVNTNGCSYGVDNDDTVFVAYSPEARLMVPDTSQCQREAFQFINQSVDTIADLRINPIDELRMFFDGVLLASGPSLDTVSYTHNNAGDYPVLLVALNDQGCVDSTEQMLRVNTVPLAIAEGSADVCVGLEAELDASGSIAGTTYSWAPAAAVADPNAAVTTASLTASTSFVLTVDNGFCASQDSVRVNVIENLDLLPGPDHDICLNEVVQLEASLNTNLEGVDWVWSPSTGLNDPNALTPFAAVNGDAAYTITATCGDLEEATTVFITQLPQPEVEASADTMVLILGSSVGLLAEGEGGTGTLGYQWVQTPELSCTDCPDPRATPAGDRWFTVNVVDEEGCVDVDSVYLRVYTDCLGEDFEIGKAFSPNGDGLNDQFAFRGETIADVDYVRVWNRWGELVFETGDINDFWDGTHRDQPLNPAVFAWAIRGTCLNGEPFLRTGDVTLVK
jgi:gliding motility-associated-like protein